MIYPVKEFLKVHVNYPAIALITIPLTLANGHVC